MAAKKRITIIGLATFGEELALELTRAGAEVTALDMDASVIQGIRDAVAHTAVVDGRDAEALAELGVDQNDWVVIATRRHFEMSVLILHTLQEMGVKQIVALAAGKDEAQVLEKLGANRVVFPERDIAQSQARLILNPALRRYTELAQNYSMVEIEAPRAFVGHTLEDLKVRTRYGVLVVAVRNVSNEKDRPYLPEPDLVLKPGDQMLLIGSDDRIHKLTSTQSA